MAHPSELQQAIKKVRGLRNLCDPECEGRCRVCPQDAIDELLAALSSPSAPAPTEQTETVFRYDTCQKCGVMRPCHAHPESAPEADKQPIICRCGHRSMWHANHGRGHYNHCKFPNCICPGYDTRAMEVTPSPSAPAP